ncbi:related to transporter protein [Phialocephala subalpina]|uniref:Related to transporter protein n=1 Tax=Phialocephala subalpina TaxID=576137 RepID=A0A1L7XT10_9HELO|nr:related to transporter protein [Phialocephala subalpina]
MATSINSRMVEQPGAEKWYDKWRWYEKETSREEKTLLRKLDFIILTFGCLTFFTKFLDLQAFQNAYVSGMKEDTGMEGNDLQYTTGVFQAGYCAAMIPSNILLTRVRPNILIPAFELVWGILTLLTAYVKTVQHVYILRFFSGIFECVAYPGVIYCIGCWYKRSEVSRRLSLFYVAGPLGTMFAGYLESATYTNLNGVNGLAGWRWLFIVCGCITLPVSIFGAIVFPARPDSSKPSWILTADEVALARRRLNQDGAEAPAVKLNGQAFTKIFKNWHCISQINNYPTGQSALSIVAALVGCYWADASGKHWLPSLFICGSMTFGSICMAVWDIPVGLKFFSFYIAGLGGGLNPLFMGWASTVTYKSAEERAVTIASMNAIGQALLAGLNIVTFPTPSAPRFKFGWYWVMANNFVQIGLVLLIMMLHNREKKRDLQVLEGSANEIKDLERVEVLDIKKDDLS